MPPAKTTPQIRPGSFWTNGARLIEVYGVSGEEILVEEGSVEEPDVSMILRVTLLADWKPVKPTKG